MATDSEVFGGIISVEVQVAWIPVDHAWEGHRCRIGDDLRTWMVMEVYEATTLTAEDMRSRSLELKALQWELGN